MKNTCSSGGRHGLALPVACVLATGMFCSPSHAQSAASQSSADQGGAERGVRTADASPASHSVKIEEILVTPQFRKQKLQNTPIAITAISGSTLAARSQTNVTQIGAEAPNVTLTPAGAGFGSSTTASIRGVGQYDFNFALEPGVGLYVDDVYYGVLFGSEFDLLDLDRVEVLRGPQGTLSGKNSIGGAIKLFSKKPDDTQDAYVEGSYGAYNKVVVRAGTNYTLVPDKLWIRMSGVSDTQDGYFERLDYTCLHPGSTLPTVRLSNSCKLGTEGGTNVAAGRIALRWHPSESFEDNFIADLTSDNSEVQATKLIYQNNPIYGGVNYLTPPRSYTSFSTYTASACGATGCVNGAGFSIPPDSTAHGYGFSNNAVYTLGDGISVTAITAWRRSTGEFSEDADTSPVDIETAFNQVTHEQFTQELRVNGSYTHWLDYTLGGFFYNANDRIAGRLNIALAPDFYLNFLDNDPIHTESYSGFAHVVLHLTDKLNLTGGLRYTEDQKSYTYSRLDPQTLGPAFFVGALTGFTGEYPAGGGYQGHLDYRANIDYRLNDELLTYASISTGFKGGGVNPRPFFITQALPFDSENLTSYEVGFKSNLFNDTVRFNGAGFYSLYHDLQETLLTCPFAPAVPCALPANVANAHIKGVEFETTAHPYPGVTIDGSVSYLDFNYTKFAENVGITTGMVAPYTNKWKASAGIQYAADLGQSGTLTPRIDWAYQSEFFTNAVNSSFNEVPARFLMNARLAYTTENGKWTVAGAITNLTNKFYYLNKFDLTAGFGTVQGQPGAPREWAITVTRKF